MVIIGKVKKASKMSYNSGAHRKSRRCEFYQYFDDLRLPVRWYAVMLARNLFTEKAFWNVVFLKNQNEGREMVYLLTLESFHPCLFFNIFCFCLISVM